MTDKHTELVVIETWMTMMNGLFVHTVHCVYLSNCFNVICPFEPLVCMTFDCIPNAWLTKVLLHTLAMKTLDRHHSRLFLHSVHTAYDDNMHCYHTLAKSDFALKTSTKQSFFYKQWYFLFFFFFFGTVISILW